MHLLILPSFYPEKHRPNTGLFFKNQAIAISNIVEKTGVVYVEQKSFKKIFSSFWQSIYQVSKNYESGVLTYRLSGLSFLNQYEFGIQIWMFASEYLFRKYIKDNGKPDIIHAHNMLNAGRLALRIKKKFNIPYIITEHASSFLLNTYNSRQIEICKGIVFNSKSVIAVSTALSSAISNRLGYFEIDIVPNIVDTGIFKPSLYKSKLGFTFICVGNLLKNKGQKILIEAFVLAFSNNKKVQLLLCGEGPDFDELQILIKRLN
jgi:glycosyltransferase involved in cell wall biosynthesis